MKEPKKDILIGIFIFLLDIALLYYLWKNNAFLTLSFLIISAVVLIFWTNKEQKFLYIAGFILGPVYDITLVPTGIWNYGNPTMFGVPLWLPPAYGASIVAIVKIGKGIQNIIQKR